MKSVEQGIYPTIIIVLAALQKTHCEHQFTCYTGPSGMSSASSKSTTAGNATSFRVLGALSTVSSPVNVAVDGLQGSCPDDREKNEKNDEGRLNTEAESGSELEFATRDS